MQLITIFLMILIVNRRVYDHRKCSTLGFKYLPSQQKYGSVEPPDQFQY